MLRSCHLVSNRCLYGSKCNHFGQFKKNNARYILVLIYFLFCFIKFCLSKIILQNKFRFIQPVKKRSKRRFEKYDKSPIFDSVICASGNVCSHKKGCDEFVLSVSIKRKWIENKMNLIQSFVLGTENILPNRHCNRINTEHIE